MKPSNFQVYLNRLEWLKKNDVKAGKAIRWLYRHADGPSERKEIAYAIEVWRIPLEHRPS